MGDAENEKNEVEVVNHSGGQYIRDLMFDKNNIFIDAAYDLSLEENQLFNLCISDTSRLVREDGTIRAKIPISEIKAFFNGNEGSFYTELKKRSANINKCQLGLVIDGNFRFYQVIQTVIYEKEGKSSFLYVTYNTDLVKMGLIDNLIKKVRGGYTKLSLRTLKSFKKKQSLRLYEILRRNAYQKKNEQVLRTSWDMEFNRYELLFDLGIIDSNDEDVKGAFASKTRELPDYEKIALMKADSIKKDKAKKTGVPVEKVKCTNPINDWASFRIRVLEPAIKEINEKTELYIGGYRTFNDGKYGRVKTIIFEKVRYKTQKELDEMNSKISEETQMPNNEILTEGQKMDFCDSLRALLLGISPKVVFSTRELLNIAEASDFNETLISEKYKMLLEQTTVIESAAGWMINAIRENYPKKTCYKPEKKSRKKKSEDKKSSGSGFCDFEQRSYNYEAFEKLAMGEKVSIDELYE